MKFLAGAACSALIAIAGAQDIGLTYHQPHVYYFTSEMTMNNVVPALPTTNNNDKGIAWMMYDENTGNLNYDVMINIEDGRDCALYGPAQSGLEGSKYANLGGADPSEMPISGSLSMSQEEARYIIDDSAFYIQCNSDTNPDGHMRGQVVFAPASANNDWTHGVRLTADAVGASSSKGGLALFKARTNGQLTYKIMHTVVQPGKTVLLNNNKNTVLTLANENNGQQKVNTIDTSTTVSNDVLMMFLAEEVTTAVTSRSHVYGEIGGRSGSIAQYFVHLTNGQVTQLTTETGSHGFMMMSYREYDNQLEYMMFHNITNPTAAHIHGPADFGQDAGVVTEISSTGTSPITGTFQIVEDEDSFLQGQYYAQVHSAANANGELRGQMLPVVNDDGGDSVDAGVIAGAVVGSLVGVGVLGAAGVFAYRRRDEISSRLLGNKV